MVNPTTGDEATPLLKILTGTDLTSIVASF
jgi:hypothetical protein